MVQSGFDAIVEVPASRWDVSAHPKLGEPVDSRVRHGSFMSGSELFDNAMFSISPAEALAMDPQQRLLLEHGYEALHRADLDRPHFHPCCCFVPCHSVVCI